MLQTLDRKIAQLHEALGNLVSEDFASLKIEHGNSFNGFYSKIDFSQNMAEETLRNRVSLLLANIGCMRDHLKIWCQKNGKPFIGDKLINTNKDAAIVHDLWNIDKHAELKTRPKSGLTPALKNLNQSLTLGGNAEPGAFAFFSLNPTTGQIAADSGGGGKVSLVISGDVVDENGKRVGDFLEICKSATEAWEAELQNSGVQVAKR